ncbi:MAG: Multiple EGF-like-domain protein 3 precursor [Myxococcaceae bacterium]|jgi:hypothetical protein|nr:Multiple EGF-like-domain protein 3 precursor [Myxococcaceae bacterium]
MKSYVSLLAAGLVVVACSSSKSGGTAATNDGGAASTAGTVPADLRDVERDGEGLVTTTFGSYPDYKADWARAASVLGLLQQVWTRAKAQNPGLPAGAVTMVDTAIADLDAGINAMDQKKAAQAANQVGLACPPLFDFFHPDAPQGILRMDAVFRQVGLDAKFADPATVAKDVTSLETDYAATKDAINVRAPMCHRVGGTATVTGDIETSLANIKAALAKNPPDLTVVEQESENGALEIDTLELLFDCPPDNIAPTTGLGAKCTDDTQCDAGQTCDKTNAGGKCSPAATNEIGTPCSSTVDCGTDGRSACQTEAGDNYKGGYCFMEPCNDINVCPPGGTCVSLGGESPGCFKRCAVDGDCRQAEGYVCQLFSTTPPIGFGPTDHACAFPCTRDADCHTPLKCDVASGKCQP